MSEEKNLNGLGGWLILVGLGIVISPFKIIIQLLPTYNNLFSNNAWSMLTTPGSEAYHPLWKSIIVGEITINFLLVFGWIFLGFLFFTKKRIFPRCYIAVLLCSLFFIVIDAFVIKIIFPDEVMFDPETAKATGRTLLACLILIPYMRISKRVKVTFTNELTEKAV